MADDTRKCACKGIRKCLICDEDPQEKTIEESVSQYLYCIPCNKAYKITSKCQQHPFHNDDCLEFPGVTLIEDFITEEEENDIANEIDKVPWVDSQSGRRKQDYGPKVNFKKKKLNTKVFTGFPKFTEKIVERLKSVPDLSNFVPVELCNLEYAPEHGSSIDPHFDDFWLWGERLVTLNLLSDTYLSMTKKNIENTEVLLPMKRRSLIIIYGPSRFEWLHGIHRHHILSRRLGITLREATDEFMAGGALCDLGNLLKDTASRYDGISVGCFCNSQETG